MKIDETWGIASPLPREHIPKRSRPKDQRIVRIMGEIFWGYVQGVGAKQSPKFHWFSWLFGRDSPLESKFSGVFWVPPVRPVGKTGQTGLLAFAQPRPVRPVQCTGQTGPGISVLRFLSFRFRFASWFRSLVRGLLCWFSFFIAIPNFDKNA